MLPLLALPPSTTRRFWNLYVQLQLQNAITQRGFKTCEGALFGGSALVLLLLAIMLWLHFKLRTKTKFHWQWREAVRVGVEDGWSGLVQVHGAPRRGKAPRG